MNVMCERRKRNTANKWQKRARNGMTYLDAPNGTRYYGTAAMVRNVGVYPSYRHALANSLRLYHKMYVTGSISHDELRDIAVEYRLDAIMYSIVKRNFDRDEIDANTRTMISAAARVVGVDEKEFIRSAIAVALEETRHKCGGELPYTRHERAALMVDGATDA